MLKVARFLRGFLPSGGTGLVETEVFLPDPAQGCPATLLRPPGTRPHPGWVLLHGITVSGRQHPVLRRFANALASSGAVVIIPEVPAWRDLRLDETAGDTAVAGAVAFLRSRADVEDGLRLIGFSFGATQALMSASNESLRPDVRGVVAFGGYCDLGRTLHCMMTGEHEWRGERYRFDPDPYGRWIVAANYIDRVPEFAHMTALKRAARDLAVEAGMRGVYAGEADYDERKKGLRGTLPEDERDVWDLIAPLHGVSPPREAMGELAGRIVAAATLHARGLDPRPKLTRLDQRIVLAHGREDRLIPFTETLRLATTLPATASVSVSITRLFSHSREADRLGYLTYPREVVRYLALLRRVLTMD